MGSRLKVNFNMNWQKIGAIAAVLGLFLAVFFYLFPDIAKNIKYDLEAQVFIYPQNSLPFEFVFENLENTKEKEILRDRYNLNSSLYDCSFIVNLQNKGVQLKNINLVFPLKIKFETANAKIKYQENTSIIHIDNFSYGENFQVNGWGNCYFSDSFMLSHENGLGSVTINNHKELFRSNINIFNRLILLTPIFPILCFAGYIFLIQSKNRKPSNNEKKA